MTYDPRNNYPQPPKQVRAVGPKIVVKFHRASVTVKFIDR